MDKKWLNEGNTQKNVGSGYRTGLWYNSKVEFFNDDLLIELSIINRYLHTINNLYTQLYI